MQYRGYFREIVIREEGGSFCRNPRTNPAKFLRSLTGVVNRVCECERSKKEVGVKPPHKIICKILIVQK